MNTQKYTLENIKKQARKQKKQLGITHTEALELVSKNLGYASWIHCQRSINSGRIIPENEPTEIIQLNFNEWLKKHRNRDSPLGDLSQEMLKNSGWPLYKTLKEYQGYLLTLPLPRGASEAMLRAWKSYRAYLRRSKAPKSDKPRDAKPGVLRHDSRKVVLVKNAKPVHINKRTIEIFKACDLAWISWDGRKATPVTVLEADDRNYSLRIERPLKKSGTVHSLFLDEVRSTPELACANHVTF
ncbi:MAG: hypothetical protein EOO20_02300 [Chryseobacterium sp.]|nr:MAG: hypothetical protein EOO20_02300 [Chryseobacterium sp.]